jgi:hypothetical protein
VRATSFFKQTKTTGGATTHPTFVLSFVNGDEPKDDTAWVRETCRLEAQKQSPLLPLCHFGRPSHWAAGSSVSIVYHCVGGCPAQCGHGDRSGECGADGANRTLVLRSDRTFVSLYCPSWDGDECAREREKNPEGGGGGDIGA